MAALKFLGSQKKQSYLQIFTVSFMKIQVFGATSTGFVLKLKLPLSGHTSANNSQWQHCYQQKMALAASTFSAGKAVKDAKIKVVSSCLNRSIGLSFGFTRLSSHSLAPTTWEISWQAFFGNSCSGAGCIVQICLVHNPLHPQQHEHPCDHRQWHHNMLPFHFLFHCLLLLLLLLPLLFCVVVLLVSCFPSSSYVLLLLILRLLFFFSFF